METYVKDNPFGEDFLGELILLGDLALISKRVNFKGLRD